MGVSKGIVEVSRRRRQRDGQGLLRGYSEKNQGVRQGGSQGYGVSQGLVRGWSRIVRG